MNNDEVNMIVNPKHPVQNWSDWLKQSMFTVAVVLLIPFLGNFLLDLLGHLIDLLGYAR